MLKLASLAAAVVGAAAHWSDGDIATFLAQHRDELPAGLRDIAEPTREDLRSFFEVAEVSVEAGDFERTIAVEHGDEPNVDPSDIWAIGKGMWDVVQNNKPVVNITAGDYAGAVPVNVTDWTKLTGWENAQSDMYTFKFKSVVGSTLTELKWVFNWSYGGQYNGEGQYVTLATTTVDKAYAYLSENIEATATASDPINYGTEDSPVGGLNLHLSFTSAGMFESTTVGCEIILRGDGQSQIITCDQNY